MYQDANDLERAISSYHTAISYRPTLASAYLNLGLCAWEKNDSETAKEVFEKCLKLDATHLKNPRNHRSAQVACAYNLGESLSQIGDFDQAEYYFQKALLHAPSHIPAYLTLSQLRLKQKRYTEALEVLQSAYRLNETNSLLNFHMGVYYSARGDHPEAIKYLKRAEVVNGKNADVLSALAESCRQTGLNEEAEKYYERLAEMGDETSPFAYSNYAAILHVNGKYEKAERMYKKAIEINPNDSLSNKNLRKLYRLMNR
ncbi:unnamed protein product [Anisakis simplex]|uniref:Uncharacterized protein n=1 Tax=Anisakis simplex TaxID=6269 RepID=A0A3P6QNH6_ANISI|nr:unnamed protein product [Anisakis simplex]